MREEQTEELCMIVAYIDVGMKYFTIF